VAPGERREIELTMNKLPEAARLPGLSTGEETAGRNLRTPAWVMLGVAGAFGVLGAGFGLAESAKHADAVTADPTMTKRSTVNAQRDDGSNLAIGAWVGLSVGAAALAASTVLFILDGARGETHEAQRYVVAPSVTQGGAGIAAAARF
jgi:hypothetical protein